MTGCGVSESEQTRIAQAACSALGATLNDQGLERIQIINRARQKLGTEIYSGSGKEIVRYLRFGTCIEFVKNTDGFREKTDRRRSALHVMIQNDASREKEGKDSLMVADLVTDNGAYFFWTHEVSGDNEEYRFLDSETMMEVSNARLDGVFTNLWGYTAREKAVLLEDAMTNEFEKERLEGEIIDGKIEGELISFDADGYVYERVHHLGGKRNGSYEFWWDDKQIMQKASYAEGKLHGVSLWFYENGQLERSSNYNNGVLDGKEERFKEDGTLDGDVVYINGKREGAGTWNSLSTCFKNGQEVDMSVCK